MGSGLFMWTLSPWKFWQQGTDLSKASLGQAYPFKVLDQCLKTRKQTVRLFTLTAICRQDSRLPMRAISSIPLVIWITLSYPHPQPLDFSEVIPCTSSQTLKSLIILLPCLRFIILPHYLCIIQYQEALWDAAGMKASKWTQAIYIHRIELTTALVE